MKYIKSMALMLALAGIMVSCKDDDVKIPGNPVMEVSGNLGNACFGDTLRFNVKATDESVPLSTIHADLYFDSELVSSQVVRTKVSGETYECAVYIPYVANQPDGEATLLLTLQNINFTKTEKAYNVSISHADYPYLTFVAEDGAEYRMNRESMYNYSVTDNFQAKMSGTIVAPAAGGATDEVTFGYENGVIKVNGISQIPFTNTNAGEYTISFNTNTFEGSPFLSLTINNETLMELDEDNLYVDLNLAKGDDIVFDGFPEFENWWLNPDYFQANELEPNYSFMAYEGKYRIIADLSKQYFKVVKLNGSEPATLNEDGTGLPWILGDGIGYPNLSNAPSWNPGQGIPMAPVTENIYKVTVEGGVNINVNSINFKVFGQDGWGTELTGDMLTSVSDLIGVGDGTGGHDNGNLYLKDGVTLEAHGIYVITLDLSAGINSAILKAEMVGSAEFEEKPVAINGKEMDTADNSTYSLVLTLNQYENISITGDNVNMSDIYLDPDYFTTEGGNISFNAVGGYYNVVLNLSEGTLGATMVDEAGSDLELGDGTGDLWMMGWGVGSPSMDHQFGWDPGKAYSLAQVAPAVFQFTGKAGPEVGSAIGDRLRYDYLSFKFFGQNGWGFEFNDSDNVLQLVGTASEFIKNAGNFELADGVNLEEGATYRITIDLSNGLDNGTIDFEKL